MLSRNTIITLDNGQEYGIILVEIINMNEYALLINTENKKDIKICKVTKEEQSIALVKIENEELENVFPIFYKKAKKYLNILKAAI